MVTLRLQWEDKLLDERKHTGGWNMLKKILVTGLCALSIFSAGVASAAPHWQLWGDQGVCTLYFDIASLHRSGNLLTVTEKEDLPQVDNKGVKGSYFHRQYDTKKNAWRTVGRQVYNAKGKVVMGNKKQEPWQKIKKSSPAMHQMDYLLATSRQQGPWMKVKNIGSLAVKSYNYETIKKSGKNTYEVWERLDMNKVSGEIKTVITLVKYDLQKQTASTLYTCNFNAQGELVNASGDVDNWSAANDTYGEYIGQDVKAFYEEHHSGK